MSPLPPADPAALFRQGLALYHSGLPFEAHEVWETLWLAEAHAPRKLLLQALIQLAAARHKLLRGNPDATLRLLARAHTKLLTLTPTTSLLRLCADLTQMQSAVTHLDSRPPFDLPPNLVPTLPPDLVSFTDPA